MPRLSHLFALALLLANGVACSPQIRNERKPLGMIPVNPESRSIVLRAPVIFLFRLENAQAGDAASASGGTHLVRPVQLTIRILEIFKGELDEQPGTSVSLKISQSERGPGRQYALPGVWSGLSLAPGGEYIAFSRTASRSAAVVAGDEGCQRIFPASEALADLRIALAAENSGRPIGEILQMALPVASQIGYLLAEYLSVKTMDLQLPDPLTFGFLMDLMEARALHETPRITFLDDAYAKVIDSDRPLPRIVNRFVVALLRVLAIPEAAEYRSRILEDYLPHALRLDDKENIRKSVDVLSSYPNDRVLAARVLSGSPRLLAWLNAR